MESAKSGPLPLAAESETQAGSSPAYTLAHLSDLHLSSLDHVKLSELLSKRMLGYLSWRGHRRAEHRSEVLAAMVRDLRVTRPDHIAVTGDLTHLGLPAEFLEVRRWLEALGSPSQVTVIPGNHEAYVDTPDRRTLGLWGAYMASDDPDAHLGAGRFPSLRIRGPLALIGLSSACPTPPFFASGSLGRQQLAGLGRLLGRVRERGLLRAVLVHHPPLDGTVGWRKRLTDASALRTVLAEGGVQLVLHGHAHRSAFDALQTPVGRAPVIGVPSGSAIGLKPGRRAQYHLYHFSHGDGGWRLEVSVRGYTPEEDSFVLQGTHSLALPTHGPGGRKSQTPMSGRPTHHHRSYQ